MTRRRGPSNLAIGAALLVLALLVTYFSFAKDIPFVNEPFEIQAAFRDTAGINAHSPVRIAGVEVGEVTKVRHTRPGAQSATVTLALRDKALPLHDDASARIRPRIFLEGNFFVDLSPGSPGAAEMDEGATIPAARTATPVQFDQVLRALKSDTRNDLRQVFNEVSDAQAAGGARAFNASLRFQPAAYKFSAIVSEALLGKRPRDLGDWVRDQGVVSGALDADPARLRALVADFNTTAGALADRVSALSAAVGELPRTLRAATPAFDALNDAFPDVQRFARDARTGVRSLGPTV
ncbi:MAG: phospholipid/cholesterol/gamma-HCH transport system substrate-binding protein, partial [Solirubrobacteraceae bacterium]|nr:phospholipid/cholesterol/gamma-HCH transport system substrate-binding protein [Solirubrobacteraceae bacterium]